MSGICALRRKRSSGSETSQDSRTLNDVLASVVEAEKKHFSASRTRRFSERLGPLLDFLSRYAAAVDCIVQGAGCNGVNPACIVWGILRGLIEVCSLSHSILHDISTDPDRLLRPWLNISLN